MIRGVFTGFVMAIVVGLWVMRRPVQATAQRHMLHPTPDVIERAAAQTNAILNTIERESPWILKPNAKLSNNSSAQS